MVWKIVRAFLEGGCEWNICCGFASLQKSSQDTSTARRWVLIARCGERHGTSVKSSKPKQNLKLIFLDKNDKRGKVVSAVRKPPKEHSRGIWAQQALGCYFHEQNLTLNFCLLNDPDKIYQKKKLCVKECLNKACRIRAWTTI